MTTKPEYARPTNLTYAFGTDTTAELVWKASRYANFFILEIAKNDDFEHAHKQTAGEAINVNGFTVEDLKPDTKYWARVAVCNYEGVRLSPWSVVKTFRTAVDA